jgi:hypothetical protein
VYSYHFESRTGGSDIELHEKIGVKIPKNFPASGGVIKGKRGKE